MRTSSTVWRWPFVRRYCFVRFFLKTRTLRFRISLKTVAFTETPFTVPAPGAHALLPGDEHDVRQLEGLALFGLLSRSALDAENVAGSDLHLFAAGLENRVHEASRQNRES